MMRFSTGTFGKFHTGRRGTITPSLKDRIEVIQALQRNFAISSGGLPFEVYGITDF
jgi:hypothetical protein